MFKNYLTVGIRNLRKYKVFSLINIFGLAVAMSVCLLIILMLADQKSYDQFHANKERIYRVLSEPKNARQPYATTPFPLAAALKAGYPAVEEATHLMMGVGGDMIFGSKLAEIRGFFADASFFNIMSYPLEQGNKTYALRNPNSAVITKALAQRLFGAENPLGKTVQFVDRGLHYLQTGVDSPPASWGSFTITGVIADKGYKSHLKFDALVSAATIPALVQDKKLFDLSEDWEDHNRTWTYVLLKSGKTSDDLMASLDNLAKHQYAGNTNPDLKDLRLTVQTLSDLTSDLLNNEISYRLPRLAYYFLAVLALVIMLSACLNYTNLSVARALTRAKEIGVRKASGARKKDLIFQFLSESVITAVLALLVAVLLLVFIKPAFRGLWINRFLNFELQENLYVYFIFAGFAIFIGLAAGIFPALHLSKFQPIQVLKNGSTMRPGKIGLRKVLSVSQFVISFFFIATSLLIFNQFRHYLEFEYGFNTKNIVNIELQGVPYQKLANALRAVPGVSQISACDVIPATGTSNTIPLKQKGSKEVVKQLTIIHADENFVENLGIRLVAGKNLPEAGASSGRFVLVNRSAVKELGYGSPAQMLGQELGSEWSDEALEVIGVTEDFQTRVLLTQHKPGPLVIRNQPADFKYLNVKIASPDLLGTVAELEGQWKAVDPLHPFRYEFYDRELAATHQGVFDVVSILGFIAFLAVVISCLGLLGMATYTAERRRKEVGIRKVLGAEALGLAFLLSREFLIVLAISVAIAAPLSYVLNNLWLQNLSHRVNFGFGTLLASALILLIPGLLTIGSQTFRVARSKPVDSLRME